MKTLQPIAIGMIHIKGVNDKAWKEYLSTKKEVCSLTHLTLSNRSIIK